MKHRKLLVLLAFGMGCLAGCGGSAQKAAVPVEITGEDAAVLMAAAQATLERMHFTLDKYDMEAGYLRTRPLRAGQFFEPWRSDNASARAAGQANIDCLRRTVEVFAEPKDGVLALRCAVKVEKLSIPPRPVRGTSKLAAMYTESSRDKQSLVLEEDSAEESIEWVDLGSDFALEQRILEKIQKRLRKV